MSDIDFKKLSKNELEDLGLKYGLDLDRRLLKSKMVKQLKSFIDSLSKDDLEQEARKEGVELDKRYSKDKLVKQVAKIGEERDIPSVSEDIKAKMRNLNF
jgi:hypothetical protein